MKTFKRIVFIDVKFRLLCWPAIVASFKGARLRNLSIDQVVIELNEITK